MDPEGKLQDIQERLPDKIEELCDCGFTSQHITSGEFQCLSQPEDVTYRAGLSGTTSKSSSEIFARIEEWVTSGGASLVVQGVRMSLDSSCRPVTIESFVAQECAEEETPATEETPPTTEETPPTTKETPPTTKETPPTTEETPPITEETPPTTDETESTGSSDTQSDNTAAVVGGVVAVVVVLNITIAVVVLGIAVLFVWQRRAELSIQYQEW